MAFPLPNPATKISGAPGDSAGITNVAGARLPGFSQKVLNAMQRLDKRLDTLRQQAAAGRIEPELKEEVLMDLAAVKPALQRSPSVDARIDASYRSLDALASPLRDLPKNGRYKPAQIDLKTITQTADADLELVRGFV